MKLVFGANRRQQPIELVCPGGRIVVSRTFGGTVLVRFLADNGTVEIGPDPKEYVTSVKLIHEAAEEP